LKKIVSIFENVLRLLKNESEIGEARKKEKLAKCNYTKGNA
jgi:hypothetical protein